MLIIYQEFTIRNANHAWKEKKSNQNVNLYGLEIIDWIANAKNTEKKSINSKNGVIKTFLNMHQFCNDDFD